MHYMAFYNRYYEKMFEQPTPVENKKSTHFCVLPVWEIGIFMSVWDCKGFLSYKNEKSP